MTNGTISDRRSTAAAFYPAARPAFGRGDGRARRRPQRLCGRPDPLGFAARHARGARRLSLLGGQEVRLFRRDRHRHGAGPVGRDRDREVRRSEAGRHGLSRRPACSPWPCQGIPLVSVFHMGGGDMFSFAFRKGEGPKSSRSSKARRSCSAAPAGSRSPIRCCRAGVDITKVKYVEAGWPTWGTARRRPGRRRPVMGGACAPNGTPRASTSNTSWARILQAAGQQLRHAHGRFRG